MFLKEKRGSNIMARGCANGGSQREFTTKSETSSPTVSLEAMVTPCAINVRGGRYVVITNIPGEF